MATRTPDRPNGSVARLSAVPDFAPAPEAEREDRWPHTSRLEPWILAAFIAMVWLIPIDAVTLPIPLPVDPTPDRLFVIVMAALLLYRVVAGRVGGSRGVTLLDWAFFFVGATALVSVLANAQTLATLDQLMLAFKKLMLLGSLWIFFRFVLASVRADEIWRFAALMAGCSALTALSVVWEYRTGSTLSYEWTDALLPNAISVAPPPTDPQFGRELITGPTSHPIAMAVMFAMALPFAIVGAMQAGSLRKKLLYVLAIGLILAGSISTVRKTGAVAPVGAMLALLLYRPRQMARLLPFGIALLVLINFASPGALVRVKAQFANGLFSSKSSEGRTNDYSALSPDIRQHVLFGRGYGTFDPQYYRYLDNEYLGRIVETGFVGAAAFLLLLLAALVVAHRSIVSGDPLRGPPALAASAGVVAFIVASALFDSLSFPQAPYLFLLLAGFIAVVAKDPVPVRVRASDRQPSLPARPLLRAT